MTEERMSHLNDRGEVRMVDVSDKPITRREATAEGEVLMSEDLVSRFFDGDLPKGDAAAVARVAGIMAAKKTHELIPLCHPLPISGVEVSMESTGHGIRVLAKVSTDSRTGVEMEALTAVSVAALTIYDMVKGMDRHVEIANIRLLRKAGGRSGTWERS
ncbi:MAG: cyclic pyranopterin monophosphate synthase MoaC [Acidimicrobiia bacterium]